MLWLSGKRNLLLDYSRCWKTWKQLRSYPGLFSFADALQNWKPVLLPRRFSHNAAGRALAKEAVIERLPEGINKVTLLRHGLVFFWPAAVDNSLHYTIDQEFNPRYSHHYTTPPIELTPQSLVLDVGACEGLFAFRAIRQGLAARVICFEPSQINVKYTRMAAALNGVAERITIEPLAVGKESGQLRLVNAGSSPDGHSVQPANCAGERVDCISLDDYCRSKGLLLTRQDLIKIDAEGADLDVLLGAERLIRSNAPQIAVTTYHKPEHARQMVDFLRSVQPAYKFRLKGFSFWTAVPTPVLLQAAVPCRLCRDHA